jgi:Glycosyltransferase family 87
MNVGISVAAKRAGPDWWRTLSTGALVAAATVSVVALLSLAGSDSLGWDFRYTYLRAAERVLDGGSPYPALDDEVLASGKAYVYPPQLAVVLAPVSALPEDLVVWLAFVGAVASLMGALAVVGVRDLRCYAAVLAWGSTSNALEMTNITAFLTLAVACIWRYRATIWPLATTLGLAIATKLFLWPLAVWALATGRRHAVVRAIGLGVLVVFVSWGVIGFEDLTRYPDLLKRFSEVQGEVNSYSVVAAVVALGGSSTAGQIVTVLVGGPILVASVYYGRRALDDERSFIAAVGAALLLTPVAWLHYYVLLAVPLAIARPRLSPLWLLPIVLWVCPRDGNGTGVQPLVPTLVVIAVIAALVVRPQAEHAPAGVRDR